MMTLYFDLPRTTPVSADPSPWRDYEPSPRLVHAAVASGLLAILVAAAGVWSVILRDTTAAIACGIAVLILAHLFGLLLNLWVRPHNTGDRMRIAGIDDGSPGLTFGYSARLYYWYASFLTVLTAIQAALVVSAPPLALGAVLTAVALFVLLRHAPGRLALTPDGIYHHGIWSQRFLPWEAVLEITAGEQARIPTIGVPTAPTPAAAAPFDGAVPFDAAVPFDGPAPFDAVVPFDGAAPFDGATPLDLAAPFDGAASFPETRIRRTLFRASEDMTIQVPWLATDPALVLQAMRWYHANPSHRFELSYQIAVDRTRQRAWHLH